MHLASSHRWRNITLGLRLQGAHLPHQCQGSVLIAGISQCDRFGLEPCYALRDVHTARPSERGGDSLAVTPSARQGCGTGTTVSTESWCLLGFGRGGTKTQNLNLGQDTRAEPTLEGTKTHRGLRGPKLKRVASGREHGRASAACSPARKLRVHARTQALLISCLLPAADDVA